MKLSPRDARGISIGIEFVVSVLLGLGFGYWLDKKLNSAPWLMMVGTAFGFAAGIRASIQWGKTREAEDDAANKPADRNDPSRTDGAGPNDSNDSESGP